MSVGFGMSKENLPAIYWKFVIVGGHQTVQRHPRPRSFDGDPTIIYNLMATPRWDQHKVAKFLLRYINVEWSFGKLFYSDNVGLMVEFLVKSVEIF
jgi:hypothetical protein